jgi:hypothetical protein
LHQFPQLGAVPAKLSSKERVRFLRRLRFTRIGGWFVGITLLVSIAAFNTGNNPLYLVLGMLLSLILLSGFLSELTLKDLEVSRQLPSRIFAGQPVLVGLTLVNRKRRLPSFSLQVRERIEGLKRTDWPSSYVLRLDPGAKLDTFYQHTFPRRGVWQLQGFEIATSFPFELFRKAVAIEEPQAVIVFPQPATRLAGQNGDPMGSKVAGRRQHRAVSPQHHRQIDGIRGGLQKDRVGVVVQASGSRQYRNAAPTQLLRTQLAGSLALAIPLLVGNHHQAQIHG